MYSSTYVEFIDTVSSSCVEYYSTYVYLLVSIHSNENSN